MGNRVDAEVAIVGAGFSGIGAAIALVRAGFDDFVVLEEGDGVGGAWYWNTYPGVAVDIPSFSYQFSFLQRPDWSRVYAPGHELRAYAEHCVDAYRLRPRIRTRSKVTAATWHEDSDRWSLSVDGGPDVSARHVIGATGVFSQPRRPQIPGLDDFGGTVLHTARWDDGVDLRGRRVGVVGTGASAVQLVPSVAAEVARLTVFQRTPIWCLPKPDAPLSPRAHRVLRTLPGAQRASRLASHAYVELVFPLAAHYADTLPIVRASRRLALDFLDKQVRDPAVRDRLTPRYDLGCKRPGFSNDYLATFNRENVDLVTTPISAVTPAGVRTGDGAEHPLDVLVLATGFKVFEPGNMPPYPVRGRDGLDLEAFWAEHRYQAYEGVTIPGFPNFFGILGPYGYNGASYFTLIENQSRHIVRCLRRARQLGATRVEVTPEANARYFAEVLGRRHRQVFFRGSCAAANSYYFDAHGDAPFRPSSTLEAAWRSARFPLTDYRFDAVPAPAAAAAT